MYKEVKQTNKQTNKQKASLVHGEAVERIEKKGGVEEKEGERERGRLTHTHTLTHSLTHTHTLTHTHSLPTPSHDKGSGMQMQGGSKLPLRR